MGIFEKLEEIRERPVAQRRKLLVIWMAISMAVVIVLWIGILKLGGAEKKTDNGPSPFEVLKRGMESIRNYGAGK